MDKMAAMAGRFVQRTSAALICNSCRRMCTARKYTPRRSLLYIPGNDEKKVTKATGLAADCVVLDCEDGVAFNRKDDARTTITNLLGRLDFGSSEVCVRINSIDTGLAEEDIRVILTGNQLPHCLVVPKVETVEHIDWLKDKVSSLRPLSSPGHKIGLITQVESALGLLNLRDVLNRATDQASPLDLQAVMFGSDDFLVSIGATRTENARELTFARQSVVVHAKAYGFQAIDMVYINFKDPEGLKHQSQEGATIGYTGKQIIHPAQIDIVNEAFSPSKEKIAWASELVSAFEKQERAGKGAINFQGSMIDMPTVLQARNVLKLAEATSKSSDLSE